MKIITKKFFEYLLAKQEVFAKIYYEEFYKSAEEKKPLVNTQEITDFDSMFMGILNDLRYPEESKKIFRRKEYEIELDPISDYVMFQPSRNWFSERKTKDQYKQRKNIKKHSVTLLPRDGKIQLFNSRRGQKEYLFGLLFNTNDCDLIDQKYIFTGDAGTVGKWWKNKPRHLNTWQFNIRYLNDISQIQRLALPSIDYLRVFNDFMQTIIDKVTDKYSLGYNEVLIKNDYKSIVGILVTDAFNSPIKRSDEESEKIHTEFIEKALKLRRMAYAICGLILPIVYQQNVVGASVIVDELDDINLMPDGSYKNLPERIVRKINIIRFRKVPMLAAVPTRDISLNIRHLLRKLHFLNRFTTDTEYRYKKKGAELDIAFDKIKKNPRILKIKAKSGKMTIENFEKLKLLKTFDSYNQAVIKEYNITPAELDAIEKEYKSVMETSRNNVYFQTETMRIGGLPPLPSETFKELEKLEEQKYKKLKAQNSTFYGKPIMNDYGKQIMNSQFVIERMLYLKYEIEEMKKFIREYQELDENNLRRRAQLLCTLKVMVDLIVSSQYFGVGRPGPDYVYSWEATSSSVDYEKFIYGPLGRRRTKYQWAVGELEPGIVAPYNAAQDNIEKFKEFGEFQNFFEDELINIEYLTMFALANSDKGLIREELDTMIRYA
jgi:hypothetical protein